MESGSLAYEWLECPIFKFEAHSFVSKGDPRVSEVF